MNRPVFPVLFCILAAILLACRPVSIRDQGFDETWMGKLWDASGRPRAMEWRLTRKSGGRLVGGQIWGENDNPGRAGECHLRMNGVLQGERLQVTLKGVCYVSDTETRPATYTLDGRMTGDRAEGSYADQANPAGDRGRWRINKARP